MFFFFGFGEIPDAWVAVLLAGGLALLAYAVVTRAPGPGVIALLTLVSFATGTVESPGGFEDGQKEELNLMGWPVVLLALSLAAFVFGILRRGHDPDRAVH